MAQKILSGVALCPRTKLLAPRQGKPLVSSDLVILTSQTKNLSIGGGVTIRRSLVKRISNSQFSQKNRLGSCRLLLGRNFGDSTLSKDSADQKCINTLGKGLYHKVLQGGPEFGILFDIDGVLVRGKRVLPTAIAVFKEYLVDDFGNFRIPTVFVTNSGNCLRKAKAEELTNLLGVNVCADQVVMSHSPLRMLRTLHEKHVLVVGQGPAKDIARGLGFRRTTTIDELRSAFPLLDFVDHKRRKAAPCAFERYFPPIEAIVCFGEPIRWETSLQLVVDVLLTDGLPARTPSTLPYPHLPLIACNVDLLWMAEAPMPRYGHGCFLLCLESLYQKLTGCQLEYSALVGKPSELTYHYAAQRLQQYARHKMGVTQPIRRLYCIGDNPEADIFGANLYNRFIRNEGHRGVQSRLGLGGAGQADSEVEATEARPDLSRLAAPWMFGDSQFQVSPDLEAVVSMLVQTGVFSNSPHHTSKGLPHLHRDFFADPELSEAAHVSKNVFEAVSTIMQLEGCS